MNKTVLIIEDNLEQLEMLKRLVCEVSSDTVVHAVSALGPAYEILMEKTIDVFIVDIVLDANRPGDASGMRLVEKIRTIEKYIFTPVLFITSLEDTSKYAYTNLKCFEYIEKPFSVERVKQSIKKALYFSTMRETDKTLYFRKDGIIYPIKIQDVVYIENLNHIMYIYFEKGTSFEIQYKTCKQILEEADDDSLLQCSRSTIINKNFIENIDIVNRYITLKNIEKKIEIGITYKKKILREFGYGK